jgi:hypothetical protein
MKKIILTILSISLCMGSFAQKVKVPLIKWHDNTIANFQSVPVTYTEKGKFYYSLTNDKEKIYVLLKIFDKDVQRQVVYNGITLWINMDDKKTKTTGFRYPARPKNEEHPDGQGNMRNMDGRRGGMPGGQGQMGGRNANPLLNIPKLEVIGMSESGSEYFSTDGKSDFRGMMTFEKDGNMWYEVVIPISKLPAKSARSKNEAGTFMIGISYPGIPSMGMNGGMSGGSPDEGEGGGMGGRGGGGGGRGMGGPGGGGRGTGGRSGAYDMGSSSVAPVVVWFKDVRFASQE